MIDEIDSYSYPDYAARPGWAGPTTFPDLPPTTTGEDQRNRQAKSARRNQEKGKAPVTRASRFEPRVALVRLPTPSTSTTPDLSTKLKNRHTPTQRFAAERDRRAAELIQEANRLTDVALELYQRSRRYATDAPEYATLRDQARETEEEATHYRQCAQRMRDHSC
jgi:hypothetical protein